MYKSAGSKVFTHKTAVSAVGGSWG